MSEQEKKGVQADLFAEDPAKRPESAQSNPLPEDPFADEAPAQAQPEPAPAPTTAEPEPQNGELENDDELGDDDGGCGDECETEDDEPKGKRRKGDGKKAVTIAVPTPEETKKYAGNAQAKPAAPGAKTFTFPFLVRGAGNLDYYDLWQLEKGRTYTVQEIRTALIAAGYEEYQETDIDLTATSDGSTLIVHIKGSRKGGRHA